LATALLFTKYVAMNSVCPSLVPPSARSRLRSWAGGALRADEQAALARADRPRDTADEAAFGSAELFGERDDDAIGPAEVAEPIEILVLRHLADELGAVSPHAGNDLVDVVDGEHDTT
jgi:hypothetical protein